MNNTSGRAFAGRRPARSPWAWLQLVDRDGPFVAVPPLKRVFPVGVPPLDDEAKVALRDAKPAFDRAWDAFDSAPNDGPGRESAVTAFYDARDAWVKAVLSQVAGWGDVLAWGEAAFGGNPPTAHSPRREVTASAWGAFRRAGEAAALVIVVDPTDADSHGSPLRDPVNDAWTISQIDRADAILRAASTRIGIVTDGRWWALVSAADGVMTASGIVDSQTWIEEPDVCAGFFALISPTRLVAGQPEHRLTRLFADSVAAAEEITVALGTQVRRAVELLVTAFSDAATSALREGKANPLPSGAEVYEAAVTVMMRVVFLLFAEERGMMPVSTLFTDAYGITGVLDDLENRRLNDSGEALDATSDTWHRLLATARALYGGVTADDARIPAYGGSLFDPARFPFMGAINETGRLRLTVSDRVMLEVLRAVQYATIGSEKRRISFRDIDVEQIGYVYEGLLGYTATSVSEVVVGLIGKEGEEPEVPLDVLEDLVCGDDAQIAAAVISWVKQNQPAAKAPTVASLRRALAAGDRLDGAELLLIAAAPGSGPAVEELRERLRPYLGVIRLDLRGRPVVVQPGGLVVTETPSRKNSGAHYTPKSLAQEVVRYALEPLVYSPGPHQISDESKWVLRDSNEILDLKVADIACGSGAFLVAAAEYLAGKMVEAWHAEGIRGDGHDLEVKARRQVVAQCLYGADINAMAVEMCKLSLWLVSLDPGKPFSFVNDKVLVGNSLLGLTDARQLETLHIDPSRVSGAGHAQDALFGAGSEAAGAGVHDVRVVLAKAAKLRERLATPVDADDPARTRATKERLLRDFRTLTAQLRDVADGVVATGLTLGGKPGRALDEAYQGLRIAVDAAFGPHANRTSLDRLLRDGLTPTVPTDYERWQPLHWILEVPDVMARGGFDAIIGNPPFLGGQKLTGAMGTEIRDWFVNVLASGRRGSADLVAYFFLRAKSLLNRFGNLGLIATNTVAQGDSREVGLDAMVADGFTITRSIQSRSWPAASANLEFAAVWGTASPVVDDVPRVSDGNPVRRISTLLEPAGRVEGLPVRLEENKGIAFQGCIVLGMGFVITPEQAQEWIAADPRNAEVLFPYLNGEDLNSSPDCSASRWVIDFNDRSEAESARFVLPFRRVLDLVKPERQRLKPDGSHALRRPLPERWWQYGEKRPAMRRAIADLSEVLVIARVSKTVMPLRVPTGQVPSEACVVFATDDYGDQAVLSSSLHQLWAITYGSGMRNDPRYTPSDVFETLPRPRSSAEMERFGRELNETRRVLMASRSLGLTALYNQINDPAVEGDAGICKMRGLHQNLDQAVTNAYGWGDVPLEHGFHTHRQMSRWTVGPAARIELLDRLLEENRRRAAGQP